MQKSLAVSVLVLLALAAVVMGQNQPLVSFDYQKFTLPGEKCELGVWAGSFQNGWDLGSLKAISVQFDVQLPKGFKLLEVKATELTSEWNFLFNCVDTVSNVWMVGGYHYAALERTGEMLRLVVQTPENLYIGWSQSVWFTKVFLNNLESSDGTTTIIVDHLDEGEMDFDRDGWYSISFPSEDFATCSRQWPPEFLAYSYTNWGGYQVAPYAFARVGYMVYIPQPAGWGFSGREVKAYTQWVQPGWEMVGGVSHDVKVCEFARLSPGAVGDSVWVIVAGKWHKADVIKRNQAGFLPVFEATRLYIGYPSIPPMPSPLGKTMGDEGKWAKFVADFGATPPMPMVSKVAGEILMGQFEIVSQYSTATSDSVFWSTYSETETMYAFLEVSYNRGATWSLAVRKDGHRNYPATTNYGCRFAVNKAVYENIWYRLRWNFYDGTEYVVPKVLISKGSVQTGVATKAAQPDGYVLEQNYPNPFNPSTTIEFQLPRGEKVAFSIHNNLGQLVQQHEFLGAAGQNTITWDGRDEYGQQVAAGMYYYRIKAGEFTDTRKMLLAK